MDHIYFKFTLNSSYATGFTCILRGSQPLTPKQRVSSPVSVTAYSIVDGQWKKKSCSSIS